MIAPVATSPPVERSAPANWSPPAGRRAWTNKGYSWPGPAGEQALTEVGARVEDGPAVLAGGREPGGLQGLEMGIERRRGEAEQGGQLGGGHGQVELAEEGGAGVTEHISQRGTVLWVRRLQRRPRPRGA